MDVIIILLCFALVFAGGFVAAFVWAVRSGQFDDTLTPAARMVADPDRDESQFPRTQTPQKP
ncbi:MAG: cbb3-type cytochrome oxidase assembly protein CcoS [Kiritimatiellia bacterium]